MKRTNSIIDTFTAGVVDGLLSLDEAVLAVTNVKRRCRHIENVRVDDAALSANEDESENVGDSIDVMANFDANEDLQIDYQEPENETELFQSEESNELTDREFYLGMIGKFLFSSYSMKKIKNEIVLDSLFHRKTISFNEYNQFVKEIDQRYSVQKRYMCPDPECFNVMVQKSKKCTACQRKFARGKKCSPIMITTASIRQQLSDVITENLSEITTETNLSNSRNELSSYPKMNSNIHEGAKTLQLMINTDGVSPKQSYRGDLWPVYLSIANLKRKSRGSISKCIIAILICGISKPTDEVWEVALRLLKAELEDLKVNPVIVNNKIFLFSLDHGVFDNDAAVNIFASIGYNALGKGCLNCLCESKRSGRRILWPIEGEMQLREKDTIVIDAENQRNGFKRKTPWMEIILPTEWRLDALHVLEEGIFGRLLKEFFVKKELQEMNRVYFLESSFPSRSKLSPRSLLEYAKFNGGDRRCLFFTFLPFVLQYEVEEHQVKSCVLLLFWKIIRLLASSWLTTDIIDDIVTVLPTIAKYFNQLYPEELCQMKSHRFFCHLKHELLNFGTPYDFSSAYYEMINRTIKVGVHPYDTTSLPEHALTSMLARKDWIAQVSSLNDVSNKFKKLVKTVCPTFNLREAKFDVRDEKYNSDNSLIQFRQMNEVFFGKILSMDNGVYLVRVIKGQSILIYLDEDLSLPPDLQHCLNLLNQHPPFGIKVLDFGDVVRISKADISASCCKFSDNLHDYLFSLEFCCPGK